MSTTLESEEAAVAPRAIADWFTTEDLYRDPYAVFGRLRRESPVCWSPLIGSWLVTRRQDMEEVYGRKDLISVEMPGPATNHPTNASLGVPNILTSDGPAHAELRGSINHVMLPRTVDTYVDSLVAPIVQHRLDQLPDSGVVELHHDYFEPVSVLSLGALIGLGHVPLEKLQYWFHGLSQGAFNFEQDAEKAAICEEARRDVVAHLNREFDRLEQEPDGSLISEMLHNGMPPGQTRSRDLIIPTLLIIIVGGSQEPGHAAGMLFHGLFSHPEQLEDLQNDLEGLLPRAINEGLRWQPPLGTLERVAVRDFDLRGQRIRAGEMVIFLPGSVNRDEDYYEDADAFDIHRPEATHRAFGMGEHMCMGHWFARRQMQIGIRSLLKAYPELRSVDGDAGELTGWAARGPKRLPADLGRRAAGYHVEPTVKTSAARRPLTLPVQVVDVERVAEDVVSLTFASAGGGELPTWEPGAHVDLHIADGLIRQYSLCGDPADRRHYRIAVRRDPDGRGGSVQVHERLGIGSLVELGLPRNHFPLQRCDNVVFVAGGIGITPLLPMVRAARSTGADWRMLYLARSRAHMAFAADLLGHGERVLLWESDSQGLMDLREHLGGLPADALVYCCGPAALTEAVRAAVPDGVEVRSESFVPAAPGETADVQFEVEIEGTGRRTTVPPGRSVLQALEELDVFVPSGCTVGVCGSCVTTVVEGELDHRDAVLSEQERSAGDAMAVCVSRCRSGRLVLRPETH